MTPSAATSGYFATDRCMTSIEVKRDTFVPCKLKHGHEGDHEPFDPPKQTVSDSPAAMVFRFTLNGEKWNWPVEGEDSIRTFRELLMVARVPYTVAKWEADPDV